jgi:hypothetical protein
MSDPDPAADAPLVVPTLAATRQRHVFPATTGRWAIHLGRIVYTHNPFYVASAWMVFSGLRASFPVSSGSIDAWALTLCLMGYTLLLSLTAFLVIRLGTVWDDARSLLLLIVLMFLGISVTFDGILADSPEQAPRYYIFGWLFAGTISELLLRSLRLRLGWLFRAPFHLLLGLLFFYPLVLAPRLGTPNDPVLAWELFGFSSIAALIFLCLIPAVRRGPAYVADNGSPWPWPWFPWVLFGMLGFCVSLRAYYLCVSLHFVGASNSIFAPYFLVPLGLAAILLLLEAGLVIGSQRVVRWAIFLPLSLILMASIGHDSDPVYQGFLTLFEQRFGATPLVVTLWLAAAFYLLAAVRAIPDANYPLIITLIFVSLIPARLSWSGVDALPLAMAGAWQIAMGWRLRRSGDVVAGLCLSLVSASAAGQGTWLGGLHGILPVHLLLAILLGAGYWYQDQTGRYARQAAVTLAVILASMAALGDPSFLTDVPVWARMHYPLAMAVLLAGYGHATKDVWSYAGAAAAAVGCVDYSGRVYVYLHDRVPGLSKLAWGALFFLLAALISLLKSGLRPAWLRRKLRRRPSMTADR